MAISATATRIAVDNHTVRRFVHDGENFYVAPDVLMLFDNPVTIDVFYPTICPLKYRRCFRVEEKIHVCLTSEQLRKAFALYYRHPNAARYAALLGVDLDFAVELIETYDKTIRVVVENGSRRYVGRDIVDALDFTRRVYRNLPRTSVSGLDPYHEMSCLEATDVQRIIDKCRAPQTRYVANVLGMKCVAESYLFDIYDALTKIRILNHLRLPILTNYFILGRVIPIYLPSPYRIAIEPQRGYATKDGHIKFIRFDVEKLNLRHLAYDVETQANYRS